MRQNRSKTGRFVRGSSGNPGGRPVGLARTTRELVGEDGRLVVELWLEIMRNSTAKPRDRLEASRLLAERGWGKSPDFVPDPQPEEGARKEDPVYRPLSPERARELIRLSIEEELPGLDEAIMDGVMRAFGALVPKNGASRAGAGSSAVG